MTRAAMATTATKMTATTVRLAVATLLGVSLAAELAGQDRGGAGDSEGGRFGSHEEVTSTLDRILTDPKYRRLIPEEQEEEGVVESGEAAWWEWWQWDWVKALLDWLEELFDPDLGGPAPASGGVLAGLLDIAIFALVFVAVLLALAFILWAIVVRSHESRARLEGAGEESLADLSIPPGELPADVYVQKANQLAASGDYRAAVRQLLLGCMSWIERAGKIRYRKGLTNRDYLRAIWRHKRHRHALAAIVDVFDQVYFGRRAATREGFDRCRERYQEGFGAEEKDTSPAP